MKRWIMMGICVCCMFTLFLTGCTSTPDEPVEETPQVQPPEPVESTPEPEEPKPEPTPEPEEPPVEQVDLTEENNTLTANAMEARELAIVAGAEQYFPNELLVVDIVAREAQVVYEDGGDATVFNEIASDTVYQYMALEQASLSMATLQRISELGFENYNPDQYAIGMKSALKSQELFNSGARGIDVYEQVKKSADAYMIVLKMGFTDLAQTARTSFLQVKENADAIKASVADKEGYANAINLFSQAETSLTEGEPEDAYNYFVASHNAIIEVHETVSVKRADAELAMERARKRIKDANDVATKADSIVPLKDVEALDGIEVEDTTQESE